MSTRYFAYGSNMSSVRLQARVSSVRALGAARLPGYALVIDKLGRDGSAKANLRVAREGVVWGVVFVLEAALWPELDRFEGGYSRIAVSPLDRSERPVEATTYVSEERVVDILPREDYLHHLTVGAREHGLPEEYCEQLARWPRTRVAARG